jgi:large conductance mechanosensitive channel
MPVLLPVTFGGQWETWTLKLGPVTFGVGHFLAALINFLIVGLVAWRMTRLLVKEDAPTIKCPFCVSAIDASAVRCPYCTSDLKAAAGAK